MRRQITLVIMTLLVLTPSTWSKFKEDEQKFLSDQFRAVEEQLRAMGTQVAALNAQVADLKQSQAQLQGIVARQLHSLEELEQMLNSQRIGNEENFAKLNKVVTDARTATENSLSKLGVQVAPGQPTPDRTARSLEPAEATHGYITSVEGNDVIIDLGSGSGVVAGRQLAVYKASDKNTQVGVIQVLQVIDANSAKARIISLNPGVKLDFSDEVRLQ